MTAFSFFSTYSTEIIALFSTLNVLAFYRLYLTPRLYWRLRGVPCVAPLPLVGSISDVALVRKPIGEVYADMYRSRSEARYVGFHKFTQPAILLRDPEIIERVIVKDFDHFPSNEVQGDENLDPMFGRHLFALSGERWRRLRSAVSPGFTAHRLQEIFALIPEVCDALGAHVSDRLRTEGCYDVELRELCSNFTTSTMSTCALGAPCDAIGNPEAELRAMGRKLLEPSLKKVVSHLIFLQIPWLAKLLGIPFVPRDVTEFFRKTVFEEVSRREREGARRNDYLQMFVDLWKEGKLTASAPGEAREITPETKPKDLDDITALALAFFADGSVTTGTLISFALYELAHDKGIQESLRGEVWKEMEKHGGKLTFEALEQMTHMDMALREVLRLYPPAPFMTRSCAKRYLLPNPVDGAGEKGGAWVEKGIPVVVPVYGIQRDPRYYPDPEVFDPKRFSQEEIVKRKHFTYYPSGEGPRVCIGVKFGFLQAKAAIATMLSKFELHPHDRTPRPITLDPHYFITVSKGGLWVRIENRNY